MTLWERLMGYIARCFRTGQAERETQPEVPSAQSESVQLLSQPAIDLSKLSGELWARGVIVLAFRSQFKRNPTLNEAQFAQAVARGESGYGKGWKNAGVGSHNWGAVQAGSPPCDPARSFPYGDTHADGAGYAACFRRYPDDVTGAADFMRIMFKPNVLAAANNGDIRGVSTAMRANHYFELALEKHVVALTRNLQALTTKLGEPMPSSSGAGGGVVLVALLGAAAFGAYKVLS